MKLIFSHPTGNTFVRAAASGFLNENMLYQFNTSIAAFPGGLVDRLGSIPVFSEIHRRRFDPGLSSVTRLWPWKELGRLMATKAGFTSLVEHENGPFCVDAVYRSLDQKVASGLRKSASLGAKAVYSYEDGAALSFNKAKEVGLRCIYDLPIGYWRAARHYLQEEKDRRPEWAPTICGFKDSKVKLARKDAELQMADLIIVASQFTAKTLGFFPGTLAPVKVVPYAFPTVGKAKCYTSTEHRKLRLLFVGGLSQRKGIADLFDAVGSYSKHVELTVVGHKIVPDCEALNKSLLNHKWISSLPHNKILELMREHDALVFPSLFEGFGLVITEAMSQGIPVITTDRTAGPDFITPGKDGWIIKAGSAEAISEILEQILDNPGIIPRMGRAAMETARSRTWEDYGHDLVAALSKPE